MTELVYNADLDTMYDRPDRALKPYERVIACPECGKTDIGDYGKQFHPRLGCNGCDSMFDIGDLKPVA